MHAHRTPLPPALLVDYGGVISRDQAPGAIGEMAALIGLPEPRFSENYWAHRPGYDRGEAPHAYWRAVAGRELEDRIVDALLGLDLASWSLLNDETLEILERAHEHGCELSLLSNAPSDLADMLSDHPALTRFQHLLFSSRLGLIKPDRAVFEAALERIGRRPDEVLFIDDREANVTGALRAGLRAARFRTAAALRAELFGA
jgi:putative hydrolase of the HAD superfamily